MSIDINLVNKKTSEGSRGIRLKKVRIISYSLLMFVVSFSIILFLFDLRFSANYVIGQQNKLTQEFISQDKLIAKIFILNGRISSLSSLISQRKQYHEKTDLVFKKISNQITVTSYKIDEKGITLELSSNSLLDLNNYLNYLLGLVKTKKLNSITLEALSSDKDGFSMLLVIN